METSLVTCEGFLILQKPVHSRVGCRGEQEGRGPSLPRQKGARPSQSWAVVGVEPAGAAVEVAVRPKGSELRLEWVPRRGVIPPSQAPCSLACLPPLPPFPRLQGQQAEQLWCETSPYPTPATLPVAVWFGATERKLQHSQFEYTSDPNITSAGPTKSFLRCRAKGTPHGTGEGGPSRCRTWGMCGFGGAVTPTLLVGRGPCSFGLG